MPYVSARQRRYFNAQRGKAISESTVDEWNEATRGKKLPESAPKRRGGKAAKWAARRAASGES
jgi:hypothetical protein